MTEFFAGLKRGHYGAILADPPWRFEVWNERSQVNKMAAHHYKVMTTRQIARLHVEELAGKDCCLFLWACWPMLEDALRVLEEWGFAYKTCAFCWTKANANQLELFRDDIPDRPGMGYWTRANSEVCLLATRGKPKRLDASIHQAVISPRREHSRKPDEVIERIERLVAGPYCELFARQRRPGWDCWGNELDKFAPVQPPDPRQECWSAMWARPFDWARYDGQ
jgi:N6-adenosine-specific RNA methylase IME4